MTLAATNLKGKCQILIGKHFKVKQIHIFKGLYTMIVILVHGNELSSRNSFSSFQ